MKRKVLVVSVVLLLIFSILAGCGQQPAEQTSDSDPANEAPVEKTKLEIWVYDEFYKDGDNSPVAQSTKKFMEDNPDIEVTFIPTPYGSSSYRDKYIQAANGGGGPDVLLSDNIWVPQFAAMQLIHPLTDKLGDKKDEFFQGPIDAAALNGDIYGVPFDAGSMVLFYNKTAFEKAGLDPEQPPKTWDEFKAAAHAVTGDGMYGYGLMGGWGGSFEWLPWLWQNGGDILDESGTKVAFNDEVGIETTEFFLNLLTKDGVVPEAALAWKTWDELVAAFSNQTIAMVQGMTVMLQGLYAQENIDFEWGVAPLPGKVTQANTLGGGHWVINSNSDKLDAAWRWIDYISSSDNLGMMDAYSRISARRDAAEHQELLKNDDNLRVFFEALEYSRPRPIIPEWTQIDYDTIQPAFMRVIHEGADIRQVMNEAEEISNKILAGE
jgi:multiple sugar transport system substrate-binding protein